MSILDAEYVFALSRHLNAREAGIMRSVPGVVVGRAGSIQTWYSGATTVQNLLNRWGIPSHAHGGPERLPRSWDPATSEEELAERIFQSTAREWLIHGKGGPWKLVDYQKQALWFAMEREGGFLIEPTGAGKTVQAALFCELVAPPGPVLVVVKTGTPVVQWCRAAEQFLATTSYELRPPSRMRKKDGTVEAYIDRRRNEEERPVIVVGWDSLRVHVEHLEEIDWSAIAFDETHKARSHKRFDWTVTDTDDGLDYDKTYKDNLTCAAWRLAQKSAHRLATTATAMPDRRSGLWGQLSLVDPSWGLTATRFFKRYCDARPGEHGGLDSSGKSNTEELKERMSHMTFRVPKFIVKAQLPPCRFQTYYIPVERQDKPATGFKVRRKQLAKAMGKGSQEARQQLRELDLQEASTKKRSAVLAVVDDYVASVAPDEPDGNHGKIILFTGRHRDCYELGERLRKKFKKVDIWVSVEKVTEDEDGNDSFKLSSRNNRVEMMDAYMAHPGPCILMGTAQAWGESLDLQDTDMLGIVMLPWSPGDFEQWVGRVTRLGQKRPVVVMIFIAEGSADEKVLLVLTDKMPDIVAVTGEGGLGDVRDSLRGLDKIDEILDGIVVKVGQKLFGEEDWA